jgi:SH3-like domain-containing protein
VTRISFFTLLSILAIAAGSIAYAQDREVPYWATIGAEEVNMRVGPSRDYPIDWVFKRKGLPIKVVRLREGWRLVQDPDGAQGWIVSSLLSPQRGMMVTGEGLVDILAMPSSGAQVLWRAEPGVVGRLNSCESDWCEVDIGGRVGWIAQDRLWGAGEP